MTHLPTESISYEKATRNPKTSRCLWGREVKGIFMTRLPAPKDWYSGSCEFAMTLLDHTLGLGLERREEETDRKVDRLIEREGGGGPKYLKWILLIHFLNMCFSIHVWRKNTVYIYLIFLITTHFISSILPESFMNFQMGMDKTLKLKLHKFTFSV